MSEVVSTGAAESTSVGATEGTSVGVTEGPTPAGATPAPQAPVTPEVSVRDQRGSLRELMRNSATPESPARPRNEAGQFVSKEASSGPAAEAPGSPEVAETGAGHQSGAPTGTTGSTEATTAEVPEGMVVIDLPENHYLRERGRTQLPPVPKEWENEFRALVNDPVRRAEVRQATAERDQAARSSRKWEKATEILTNRLEQVLRDPQVSYTIHQIREQLGDDAAERHIQAVLSEDESAVLEAFSAIDRDFGDRASIAEANRFEAGATRALRGEFPLLSAGDIRYLIGTHAQAVVNGQAQLHWSDLKRYAQHYYAQLPAVQESQRRAAAQAEAQQQAQQQAEQERQAEASRRAAANPMGRFHPSAAVAGMGADPTPNPGEVNVRDQRKNLSGLFRR